MSLNGILFYFTYSICDIMAIINLFKKLENKVNDLFKCQFLNQNKKLVVVISLFIIGAIL